MSNSVGPRIRLLRNLLQARSIAYSKPFGLPTGSLTVLSLISGNPGSSQKQLSNWAGIPGPGLVSIVDELEKRGLVARERSPKDRRRNMLVLTARGKQTMDTMFETVTAIEAPIREEFGPEEMALFISFVERAVSALEKDGA